MQNKTNYFDWGEDLIWLPSLSETGHGIRTNVKKNGGLWNLDDAQRGCSTDKLYWSRSGHRFNASVANYYDANGKEHATAVNATKK